MRLWRRAYERLPRRIPLYLSQSQIDGLALILWKHITLADIVSQSPEPGEEASAIFLNFACSAVCDLVQMTRSRTCRFTRPFKRQLRRRRLSSAYQPLILTKRDPAHEEVRREAVHDEGEESGCLSTSGDYLADTQHLSTEEHGAYLLLLMHHWKTGPLPNDDAILARIARMAPDAWSIAQSVLRSFFTVDLAGLLVQQRLQKEKERAAANSLSATTKAKAAAEARWKSDAPSIAQAVLEPCPSPSPSERTKDLPEIADKKRQKAGTPGKPGCR